MAECKYQIKVGSGRYTRRCGESATQAVVFKSYLDDGYIIQTQMPCCGPHLYEKVQQLNGAGIPTFTVNL